jgi:flavin reductase (DIM6/NTAB) family NADH-FMN oxidoreductase RutF
MQETTFTPDASTQRLFREALGRFATGVTLVTIAGPEGPMGFLANSFAALSLNPPLVLWSPAKTSSRFLHYAGARHYAIHVLATQHDDWLTRFQRGGAGFAGLDYEITETGVPAISGALARFDCAQHATHEGGDHVIVVGQVLRASMSEGSPLVFSQGRYGHFFPQA